MPQYIRSDQGTNFVRGRKEIVSLWKDLQREQVETELPDICWEFSTAYAPHTNGAVERMVGLVKKTLRAAVGQETSVIFDTESFHTLVVKCEGIINSRPLTYVSTSLEDLKPITPNDFLLPPAAKDFPPVSESNQSVWLAKLRVVETALTNAWNRFMTEYLPTLHRMQKWNKREENFRIGDIVMALEKGPRHRGCRGCYPLAPDKDGVVRNLRIKIR